VGQASRLSIRDDRPKMPVPPFYVSRRPLLPRMKTKLLRTTILKSVAFSAPYPVNAGEERLDPSAAEHSGLILQKTALLNSAGEPAHEFRLSDRRIFFLSYCAPNSEVTVRGALLMLFNLGTTLRCL
jgi:hypothetical protein